MNIPAKVEAKAKAEGARAVVISAKVEEEIAQLPNEERKDFLDSHRAGRTGPQPHDPRRL